VVGCCEYGDEPLGSGATELVRSILEDACKSKSHYYNLRRDVFFRVGHLVLLSIKYPQG
jgi:hypothetical protein